MGLRGKEKVAGEEKKPGAGTKKKSDYDRISAGMATGIVGGPPILFLFFACPKKRNPKERAPQQHWPDGPQF
jgi:hypothetical protein